MPVPTRTAENAGPFIRSCSLAPAVAQIALHESFRCHHLSVLAGSNAVVSITSFSLLEVKLEIWIDLGNISENS
jgi:hypothetical protein